MYVQLNIAPTAITELAGKYAAEVKVSAAVATSVAAQLGVGDWGYLWLRDGRTVEIVKVVGTTADGVLALRQQSGTIRSEFPVGSLLYSAPCHAGVYDYVSANVAALPLTLAGAAGIVVDSGAVSFDFGGLSVAGRATLAGAVPTLAVGIDASIAPCCPVAPVGRLDAAETAIECGTPVDYAEYDPGPHCCGSSISGGGAWWALRANRNATPIFAVSEDLENWSDPFDTVGASAQFLAAAYAGSAILASAGAGHVIAAPTGTPPLAIGGSLGAGVANHLTNYGGVWIAHDIYSADNGQTWAAIPNPDVNFGNVVRANGGRWYAYTSTTFNGTKRIWYSDAATPTGWTLLANCPNDAQFIVNPQLYLAIVDTRLIVCAGSTGGFRRIVYSDNEGGAWITVVTSIPASSGLGFSDLRPLSGVLFGWSDQDGIICRSINSGVSFSAVTNGVDSANNDVRGLFERGGRIVASFSRAGVFANRTNLYSDDYGLTWSAIEHPFATFPVDNYAFIFPGPDAPEGVEIPE